MRTYTQEFTVYTVEELRDEFPAGFERAHERYRDDVWNNGWGHECVSMSIEQAERDAGSPLLGRFVEWSLYPGFAHYTDGSLTRGEVEGLVRKFPPLAGATVWLEGQEFHADTIDTDDEAAAGAALKEANEWLRDLHDSLYAAAEEAERTVEIVDEFIGHAEANEYEFFADGRLA